MKWAIVGLLGLGLVAALCATLLVTVLMTNTDDDAAQEPQDVQVLVASRDIPPMTVLKSSDLSTAMVPKASAPSGHVSNAVEVVGKVLTTKLLEGQAFTKDVFAADSLGLHLAAALPEGMRAVSVELSNPAGLEGLLYPGSVVDVLASLKPDASSKSQAVSTMLLEGVQVLQVEGKTIVSDESATEASSRQRVGRKLMVTLMVDPEQAKALQLAMDFGSVSLAMRNPMDSSPSDGGVVFMSDLADYYRSRLESEKVVQMFQESQDEMLASLEQIVQRNGSGTPETSSAPAAQTAVGSPAAVTGESAPVAKAVAPRTPAWLVTIFRGTEVETRTFDQAEQQPTP